VIRALAELVGYPAGTGVMTSGCTESNLMGLLLARGDARRLRVYCSEIAHFSVRRNAGILGLGEDAVTPIPVDAAYRLDLAALRERVGAGDLVVATAGTTDFGSIDPLPEITALCAVRGARCHVDAAYGGGALFSDRLAPLLAGLDRADTVALDLHKLGWQPVAAGVFLARDAAALDPLRTTRRVDAFKLAVTFRALGRAGLGRLVDACHELACHAAARIVAHPDLELAADPVLTTVVFRHRGGGRVNAVLRRRLLERGVAVVGRTEIEGVVWLKLTLLNPHATADDVDALLAAVAEAGAAVVRP
jgi:L-2,4-diaminobutyrate decarboxylase